MREEWQILVSGALIVCPGTLTAANRQAQNRAMTRQKKLRERVADRKAGIKEANDPARTPLWRRYGGLTGTTLSIGALFLLALEGLLVVEGKPMEFDRALVLSVVFVIGRVIKASADAVRS